MGITSRTLEHYADADRPGVDSIEWTGEINHAFDCPHTATLKEMGWTPGRHYPTGSDEANKILSQFHDDCSERCDPYVRVISWAGRVLCKRERNYYHDSDFYAIVWDDEEKELRYVEYATTRGACNSSAKVDATDEIKQAAEKWLAAWAFTTMKDEYARDSIIPKLGRRVTVERGRKVPLGTTGEVVWYGDGRYSNKRVRIRDDGGKEWWTDAKNCDVVNPLVHIPSDDNIRAQAAYFSQRRMWHVPFASPGLITMG